MRLKWIWLRRGHTTSPARQICGSQLWRVWWQLEITIAASDGLVPVRVLRHVVGGANSDLAYSPPRARVSAPFWGLVEISIGGRIARYTAVGQRTETAGVRCEASGPGT
jgi:hypothetical protein